MNTIKGHITHKVIQDDCAMIHAQTALGVFYVLIVDSDEFKQDDLVMLRFKENDVIISDNTHFSSIPNRFEGLIIESKTQGFLTRVCIDTPAKNTHDDLGEMVDSVRVYALIPHNEFLDLTNIAWYVPCAHILLEKI